MQELVAYELPEVVFFQEVETNVFTEHLSPALARLGYASLLGVEQDWYKEAIAWRSDAFSLRAHRSYLMHEFIERALTKWLAKVLPRPSPPPPSPHQGPTCDSHICVHKHKIINSFDVFPPIYDLFLQS